MTASQTFTRAFMSSTNTNSRPEIAVVNSKTFGKHFPAHYAALEEIGNVRRVDVPITIPEDELAAKLRGVNGIVASVTPKFSARVLEQLPGLVVLARHGIGCDNVDLEAASGLGILVSKVAGLIEQDAVAEQAVALLMSAARCIPQGFNSVRENRWADRGNYLGMELRKKRVGLIGIGNIGTRVAEILSLGFHCDVRAVDPLLDDSEIRKRSAIPATIDQIFESSDIISLHCPLTAQTRRMLNGHAFAAMKPGVVIVNTCRGELVDEDALCEALERKKIRAYATDVVENEPIAGDHRLLKYQNVLIAPHLGGHTDESQFGMGQTMVDDMRSVFVLGGRPGVLANPGVLDREHRRWG